MHKTFFIQNMKKEMLKKKFKMLTVAIKIKMVMVAVIRRKMMMMIKENPWQLVIQILTCFTKNIRKIKITILKMVMNGIKEDISSIDTQPKII